MTGAPAMPATAGPWSGRRAGRGARSRRDRRGPPSRARPPCRRPWRSAPLALPSPGAGAAAATASRRRAAPARAPCSSTAGRSTSRRCRSPAKVWIAFARRWTGSVADGHARSESEQRRRRPLKRGTSLPGAVPAAADSAKFDRRCAVLFPNDESTPAAGAIAGAIGETLGPLALWFTGRLKAAARGRDFSELAPAPTARGRAVVSRPTSSHRVRVREPPVGRRGPRPFRRHAAPPAAQPAKPATAAEPPAAGTSKPVPAAPAEAGSTLPAEPVPRHDAPGAAPAALRPDRSTTARTAGGARHLPPASRRGALLERRRPLHRPHLRRGRQRARGRDREAQRHRRRHRHPDRLPGEDPARACCCPSTCRPAIRGAWSTRPSCAPRARLQQRGRARRASRASPSSSTPGTAAVDVGATMRGVWESLYVYDIVMRVKRLLETETAAQVVRHHPRRQGAGRSSIATCCRSRAATRCSPRRPIRSPTPRSASTCAGTSRTASTGKAASAGGKATEKVVFLSIHADSLHPSMRGAMVYMPGRLSIRRATTARAARVYSSRKEVQEQPQRRASRTPSAQRSEGLSRDLAEHMLDALRDRGLADPPVQADARPDHPRQARLGAGGAALQRGAGEGPARGLQPRQPPGPAAA